MLGIVKNLAVSVLLRMSFTNRIIRDILRTERNIVLINSLPLPILTVHEAKTDETEDQQTENITTVMSEKYQERELVQVRGL